MQSIAKQRRKLLCSFGFGAFGSMPRRRFVYMHPIFAFHWLKYDTHAGMQDVGDPAQGAEGMAFIAGGFNPADLLLGSLEELRQILLRKPRLLAECSDLQRHIPCFACVLKPGGKRRIPQLLFEVTIEIGLFHCSVLFRQSRLRSRAVWRSRAGIAWPLLRIACTATIRRFFMKNHRTRVL